MTLPQNKLWPINDEWDYHCANPEGVFRNLRFFTPPLEVSLPTILVTPREAGKRHVKIFDYSGVLLTSFVVPSNSFGYFYSSNVDACDIDNHVIQVFDSTGNSFQVIGSCCCDIRTDWDGRHVILLDVMLQTIYKNHKLLFMKPIELCLKHILKTNTHQQVHHSPLPVVTPSLFVNLRWLLREWKLVFSQSQKQHGRINRIFLAKLGTLVTNPKLPTFRSRWGLVFFCVGNPTTEPKKTSRANQTTDFAFRLTTSGCLTKFS